MDIVLMERHEGLQHPLDLLLQAQKHRLFTATQLEHVIQLFHQKSPDALFIDMRNFAEADLDPIRTFCANIKKIHPAPILFLVSEASKQHEALLLEIADDLLLFPCNPIDLMTKMRWIEKFVTIDKALAVLNQRLTTLSSVDALTNVYNRIQFDRSLRERMAHANRHQRVIALLFIDMDNFKSINDALGHHIGDILLRQIAERLSLCIRRDDFVGRLGGDEFALILNELASELDAGRVAEKIIHLISPAFQINKQEVHVSPSIGIACYPSAGKDPISLCKNADIALARAKESGKNTYQFFTKELHEQYKQRMLIENALKFALERKEFHIAYQPEYDLKTKKIIGVEALIRWIHPSLGEISPVDFIPIAEETGLIIPIGHWLLAEAWRQQMEWYQKGLRLKLAINISPRQLLQGNLTGDIDQLLKFSKIPSSLIELELTETSIMTNSPNALKILDELSKMGISIAIDDFGTGYSSLSHLKKLPISCVKIDRSFVAEMEENTDNALIVKSIINLAANLNLDVIAEGVETRDELDFLKRNKCPHGQGFYFSKPISADELEKIITANH